MQLREQAFFFSAPKLRSYFREISTPYHNIFPQRKLSKYNSEAMQMNAASQ